METIRAAHAEERPSERPIIAYFFCDYKEPRRRSVAEVLRCLLSQILKENVANNGLVDVFTFIQSGSASATASSTVELWELLQLALGQLPRAYLVIDGIDKCIDSEDLSGNLRRLSLQPNLVRVLAIGRLNDPVLQKNFGQCPQLTITSDGNTEDILNTFIITSIKSVSLDSTRNLLCLAAKSSAGWQRDLMGCFFGPG